MYFICFEFQNVSLGVNWARRSSTGTLYFPTAALLGRRCMDVVIDEVFGRTESGENAPQVSSILKVSGEEKRKLKVKGCKEEESGG